MQRYDLASRKPNFYLSFLEREYLRGEASEIVQIERKTKISPQIFIPSSLHSTPRPAEGGGKGSAEASRCADVSADIFRCGGDVLLCLRSLVLRFATGVPEGCYMKCVVLNVIDHLVQSANDDATVSLLGWNTSSWVRNSPASKAASASSSMALISSMV